MQNRMEMALAVDVKTDVAADAKTDAAADAEFPAAEGGGQKRGAGAAKAWHRLHHRGMAGRRRVHYERGQL